MLVHPVTPGPGVLLVLEWGAVHRGVFQQVLSGGLLRAIQLPLLLLFLLPLFRELLLTLLESVIAFWQKCSH